MPRLKSAKYLHLNVVINKNCDINFKSTKKLSVYSKSFEVSQLEEEENESCKNDINITSGFSPDLQNLFQTCQTRARQQQINIQKSPLFNGKNFPKSDLQYKNNLTSQKEFPKLEDNGSNLENNQRFRKCYKYRKTSNYGKCMKKYYKCFQFNKDIEKLKKCRKKFGIKPIPLPNNKQPRMFYS